MKVEFFLKLWKMRELSIENKIKIFKTLAVSKIVHLGLITGVPAFIIGQLNIIIKKPWQGKKPKIKHSAVRNNCKLGGHKETDTFH